MSSSRPAKGGILMTDAVMKRRSFLAYVTGGLAALVARPVLPATGAVAVEASSLAPVVNSISPSPWQLIALTEDYDANGWLWRAKHTYEMIEADGTVVEWEEVHTRNAKGDLRFSLLSTTRSYVP